MIAFFNQLDATLGVTASVMITTLILFAVFFLVKKIVSFHLRKISKKTHTTYDDALYTLISKWNSLAFLILALYFSSQVWLLPEQYQQPIRVLTLVTVIFFSIRTINHVISFVVEKYSLYHTRHDKHFDATLVQFFKRFTQVMVWILGVLFVAQNLGYNVTTLLGGLGLGGVAVAFAVQNILGDIFSSISIYFDKPFQVGDSIKVGEDVGTVKKIGLRSTRLQSLDGQELVISNADLTSSRVNNFKHMPKRRVAFKFGVVYETSQKKVEMVPELVSEIISIIDKADLDRVHLINLADSSLEYEVVYFVPSRDFQLYRDVHQQVLFELIKSFAKHKIEFSYPTQRVVE